MVPLSKPSFVALGVVAGFSFLAKEALPPSFQTLQGRRALEAWSWHRDEQALKLALPAAAQGDFAAQYVLARLYGSGEAAPKNDEEARRWFSRAMPAARRAAAKGDLTAQSIVASAFASGQGEKTDYAQAASWSLKAAEKGNPRAQALMGWLAENGYGVQKDLAAAAEWYRRAADQGDPFAQVVLGDLYYGGRGVPQSLREAAILYHAAAHRGYPLAQGRLASLYSYGPDDVRNEGWAAIWYRKAALQGLPCAEQALAWNYAKGVGIDKNVALAKYWYRKAAADRYKSAGMIIKPWPPEEEPLTIEIIPGPFAMRFAPDNYPQYVDEEDLDLRKKSGDSVTSLAEINLTAKDAALIDYPTIHSVMEDSIQRYGGNAYSLVKSQRTGSPRPYVQTLTLYQIGPNEGAPATGEMFQRKENPYWFFGWNDSGTPLLSLSPMPPRRRKLEKIPTN